MWWMNQSLSLLWKPLLLMLWYTQLVLIALGRLILMIIHEQDFTKLMYWYDIWLPEVRESDHVNVLSMYIKYSPWTRTQISYSNLQWFFIYIWSPFIRNQPTNQSSSSSSSLPIFTKSLTTNHSVCIIHFYIYIGIDWSVSTYYDSHRGDIFISS